jgi:hypothetical protein
MIMVAISVVYAYKMIGTDLSVKLGGILDLTEF